MKISTQDCKNFIDSISSVINSKNQKWKRTRKYKENNLVLRDFENESGRKLTVAEHNCQLFLYALEASVTQAVGGVSDNIYGKKVFSKSPSDKEVLQFIVDCVKLDNSIVDDLDKQTVKDAVNIKSWTIWQKWTDNIKNNNDYDEEPLEDFTEDSWHDFSVYFANNNNQTLYLNPDDLKQVFWVGMPDYDTAYRIYIYQTKDNILYLGENDPD